MVLPFLLSVPHAGLTVPPEVKGICLLDRDAIENDGDGGAAEIYFPLKDHVKTLVTTDIARAIVDMNRAEDDRRKDGVVKTHTCWDVPVYSEPLSVEMIETLLCLYHRPYHREIEKHAGDDVVGIDCHTMAAVGPPVGPDHGIERPAVCLSNAGGTCPDVWLVTLAGIMKKKLKAQVTINSPFKGGYIIRRHAQKIPWLQMELSRAPFQSESEKTGFVFESLTAWHQALFV